MPEVKKPGSSKELKAIFKSIDKWAKKHKYNVEFIGAFYAFKGENFDIFDDTITAYGTKGSLKITLQELLKQIKKEKKDFMNW